MNLRLLLILPLLLFTVCASAFAGDEARITASIACEMIKKGAMLVDVRTPEEVASGALKGALNIPHDKIEERIAELGNDKNREILLYCRSGRRSGIAQELLAKHGYSKAYNAGGYEELSKHCG